MAFTPPDDAGQGRADIMRDGAEQIAAHLLLLSLGAELLLLLDLRGQRADHDGHGEHDEERQRIAGDREVEGEIRIGKNIVHADDAHDGGQQAIEIAAREARDQHDRQLKDKRNIDIGIVEQAEQETKPRRGGENPDADGVFRQENEKKLSGVSVPGRFCAWQSPFGSNFSNYNTIKFLRPCPLRFR